MNISECKKPIYTLNNDIIFFILFHYIMNEYRLVLYFGKLIIFVILI